MLRPKPLTLAAAIALAAAALAPLLAQERPRELPGSDVTVILDKGARARLRIAVPAPGSAPPSSSPAGRAAEEILSVLREDLAASGVFVVQGPQEVSILRLTGLQQRDFELYRSIGNELLLDTVIKDESGRVVLEGRVWDLGSARSVLGKRYRSDYALARRIAHTFADEIVRFFTGRAGVALTSIAFHSDRSEPRNREIYLMDYDGFNQRAITNHQTLSLSPDWAPQSDAVAYVSYLRGNPGIFEVDLATGKKTPILVDGDFNISPSFSPDGKRLTFARSVGDGNTEIFVCRRDGSGLRRLTTAGGIDTNPAWSPTGREIAFTSSRSGSPQIYVMGAEGTDLRRVTFKGDYNDGAAWSPDGTRIAHSSRRDRRGHFDIAITDLVTLESEIITAGQPGSFESPAFSPDGRKLAYAGSLSSGGGTRTQIYIMDVTGGDRRQVTSAGNNWAPAWSRTAN